MSPSTGLVAGGGGYMRPCAADPAGSAASAESPVTPAAAPLMKSRRVAPAGVPSGALAYLNSWPQQLESFHRGSWNGFTGASSFWDEGRDALVGGWPPQVQRGEQPVKEFHQRVGWLPVCHGSAPERSGDFQGVSMNSGNGRSKNGGRRTGAEPVKGTQAIRSALEGFLALKGKSELQTKHVVQHGDIALLRGAWRLKGTGPDGKPVGNGPWERRGGPPPARRKLALHHRPSLRLGLTGPTV